MSIQSEIARLNTEVTTHTDLIAQIQSALEGKAAGGGGSSGTSMAPVVINVDGVTKISAEYELGVFQMFQVHVSNQAHISSNYILNAPDECNEMLIAAYAPNGAQIVGVSNSNVLNTTYAKIGFSPPKGGVTVNIWTD